MISYRSIKHNYYKHVGDFLGRKLFTRIFSMHLFTITHSLSIKSPCKSLVLYLQVCKLRYLVYLDTKIKDSKNIL